MKGRSKRTSDAVYLPSRPLSCTSPVSFAFVCTICMKYERTRTSRWEYTYLRRVLIKGEMTKNVKRTQHSRLVGVVVSFLEIYLCERWKSGWVLNFLFL